MKVPVNIWSDGSCSHNPGQGGYAALVSYAGAESIICGYSPSTTNNRMELTAFISGIQHAISICEEDMHITIYTDSKYIYNAIEFKWLNRWNKKSYAGIKNEDLWSILYDILKVIDITVIWVKGHSGDKYNDIVDKFAVMARNEEIPAGTVVEL